MKKLSELDAFFNDAKNGDLVKYEALFYAFVEEGKRYFASIKKAYSIYSIPEDDIKGVLYDLFLKVMKNFKEGKNKFSTYAIASIKKCLNNYCMRMISSKKDLPLSLDLENKDGTTLLDEIESNDFQEDMSKAFCNEKILKIASKCNSKDEKERLKARVVMMKIQGYSYEEICKQLNLSDGQVRHILSSIKNDEDFIQLKIDLK